MFPLALLETAVWCHQLCGEVNRFSRSELLSKDSSVNLLCAWGVLYRQQMATETQTSSSSFHSLLHFHHFIPSFPHLSITSAVSKQNGHARVPEGNRAEIPQQRPAGQLWGRVLSVKLQHTCKQNKSFILYRIILWDMNQLLSAGTPVKPMVD